MIKHVLDTIFGSFSDAFSEKSSSKEMNDNRKLIGQIYVSFFEFIIVANIIYSINRKIR